MADNFIFSFTSTTHSSPTGSGWTLAYHRFLPNSQAAIPMYAELTFDQQQIVVQRITDFYWK